MTPAELQSWRTAAGLTQPGLATLLGVHPITVANWERGARGIPPYLHLALKALSTIQDYSYCVCGAVEPYDHNLGCKHAVYPTPAAVGCVVCSDLQRVKHTQLARGAQRERRPQR